MPKSLSLDISSRISVRSISRPCEAGHSARNRRSAPAAAAAPRGQDCRGRPGVAVPRQDIEDDVGRMDAAGERFGTGRLDSGQAVGQHRRQHLDHLPVAVVRAFSLRRTNPRLAGSGQSSNASFAAFSGKLRCGRSLPFGMPHFFERLLLINRTSGSPLLSRRNARTPDSRVDDRPRGIGGVISCLINSIASGIERVPVLKDDHLRPFCRFRGFSRLICPTSDPFATTVGTCLVYGAIAPVDEKPVRPFVRR
jgi:hypothetical protein